MPSIRSTLFVAVLLAFLGALLGPRMAASSASSEKIAPELAATLAANPATPAHAIVMMREQADLEGLTAEMTAAGVERKARPAQVIPVLKDVARASQAPLLAELRVRQAAGTVERVHPLWMVNAILVTATPAVIAQIAERDDVEKIFLDGPIDTDRAFADGGSAAASPGAAEPGLRVTGAPSLWGRGFTGTGILVMNLDTGVDGVHPSMAGRWLGNDAGVLATDAWLDNPAFQSCPVVPCDYDMHGTLTLSILTGLEAATNDTVGVSFGSKWIAGAVVGASTGDVLNGFEWAADAPGGTRPPADVISLSIQDPSVGQAGDCGPNGTYWQVVDAFEAIGGAIVWAAGNNGPAAQTINFPKNRITTPVNMCTIGNISPHTPTFPIHSTSSRGPSLCDGLTPKPELVAPGTTIRVATPGGSYGTFTGTSLAAPHAAGVIALLMQAFPQVSGTEIKLALLATARDLGTPGDDNTYGMGLVDANAAFNLLQSSTAVGDGDAAGDAGAPPSRVFLSETHPSPFQASTSLELGLPAPARVTLRVYNLRGEVVASLMESAERPAGRTEVAWDGRNASGERAPRGVYFFRLETRVAGSERAVTWLRKAVLID
jgi:subtilisin family serine protease